jgi:hypothetical protein
MAERGSDRPVRQFGDVDVTVLLDMSVPITGLETVTAQGVQNIVNMPGSGTCRVSLRRFGTDAVPQPVTRIAAQDLRVVTGPMRWTNWWRSLPTGPFHVVVLAIHELRGPGYIERPKNLQLLPLALAVGVAPDLVTDFSSIPKTHVLHTPTDRLVDGWNAVYRAIERIRSIPRANDARIMSRLAFTSEDRKLVDPKLPPDVYMRYAGFSERARLVKQQKLTGLHAR